MNKLKMTYQGQPIRNKSDLQKILSILDSERNKAKRLREIHLLGYAYYLVNEIEKNIINKLNVYPNPFNDKINIEFTLKESANVNIEVFDIVGSRIAVIEKKFGPEAVKAAERHIFEDEGIIPEDHTYYKTEDEELMRLVKEALES